MKILIYSSLLCFFCTAVVAQQYPPKPSIATFVNDDANWLSKEEIYTLEQKLKAYNDSTSTQIVWLIMQKTPQSTSIETYAQGLAQNWGIGQKGKDNGLLILIDAEKKKIRIEVGYGLEDKITDLQAKDIIEHHIIPKFRVQKIAEGLHEATDVIIEVLSGKYDNIKPIQERYYPPLRIVYYALLVLSILLLVFSQAWSYLHWQDKIKVLQPVLISQALWILLIEIFYPMYLGSSAMIGLALFLGSLVIYIAYHTSIENQVDMFWAKNRCTKELRKEVWEAKKDYYHPRQVEEKYQELLQKYRQTETKNDWEQLLKEIYEIENNALTFFQKRYDKDAEIWKNILQEKYLEHPTLSPASKEVLTSEINRISSLYLDKAYETLSKEDIEAIEQGIKYYKECYSKPFETIEYSIGYISEQMVNATKDHFWKTYDYDYHGVHSVRHNFLHKITAIKAINNSEERELAMRYFFRDELYEFIRSPTSYPKVSIKTKNSSYSSPISYGTNTSSSASNRDTATEKKEDLLSHLFSGSSGNDDKTSSFGGGSFGGGGATGSW